MHLIDRFVPHLCGGRSAAAFIAYSRCECPALAFAGRLTARETVLDTLTECVGLIWVGVIDRSLLVGSSVGQRRGGNARLVKVPT